MIRIIFISIDTNIDFDKSKWNPTLNKYTVDMIQTPPGTQYRINLTLSINNPLPISIDPLGIDIKMAISFNEAHILDVTFPGTLNLIQGHNPNMTVYIVTDAEHTNELMTMIGLISDGVLVNLGINEITLIPDTNRIVKNQTMEWIQDMICSWYFNVSVDASTISNSYSLLHTLNFV